MNANLMYEYVERIGNLIRTNVRKSGIDCGLQPVQIEALHYISRCNHYSNTPVAVSEYLGLTKGTVSQTLGVLENAGFIEKLADAHDKRVVHLTVTKLGEETLDRILPPNTLKAALGNLSRTDAKLISEAMETLMIALQQSNGFKSFGVCKSCHHHSRGGDGLRHCGLTRELLSSTDAEKICREHVAAA